MPIWRRLFFCTVFVLATAGPSASQSVPALQFSTFVSTDIPLGQVVWSGRDFLYLSENLGVIEASDASGQNVRQFAAFDQGGEEMRCLPAPTKPAYWPSGIYCHTPDNRIVRLAMDGSSVTELARLPASENSDGSLAFDTVGHFGYALLAVTGGSGTDGGQVFAIRKSGIVETIGSYPGPGGADEVAVAPAKFGSASGQLLLSIDQGGSAGSVLAVDRKGTVQTIASGLGNGLNPIAVIEPPPTTRASGSPAPGLYLADTTSQNVFFAPAADLESFTGTVLVGAELTGQLWLISPSTSGGFASVPVTTNLSAPLYNLEGSTYIP